MDLKYGAISQQVNGKNKSISIYKKEQTRNLFDLFSFTK
jgi:hypothetical protein